MALANCLGIMPSHVPIQIEADTLSNDVLDINLNQRDDKLPHNASVFVGSLPSNVDQGELTSMLMEHLSEHIQVKNIKVVRDSKGGVCAFVQCENAVSATALIQTLHLGVPKPFLGRMLRYEPARAFRTLLISYRMPTRMIRPGGLNSMHSSTHSSEVQLKLPFAMKVWKHRSSRFHNISYNSDAVQFEVSEACHLENAIVLRPLDFGEESLRKLVSYFGPLEKFCLYQSGYATSDKGRDSAHDGGIQPLCYPVPHAAARSPSMDSGCWEVKWEHRDDCVSALMTLRRVPHITVTWAHQPPPANQAFPWGYQHHSFHGEYRMVHSYPMVSPTAGSVHGQTYSQPLATFNANLPTAFNPTESQARPSDTILGDFTVQASNTSTQSPGIPREKQEATYPHIYNDGQASCLDTNSCSVSALTELGRINYPENESVARENVDYSASDNCRELCLPPTPALDKTNITPNTPGSQFPVTPTSCAEVEPLEKDYSGSHDKEKVTHVKGVKTDREVDPTTLFVGGLEMFGPAAWDEEKVRNFFSRFGGLESVKVVRPLNSCSAFAFIKFNNAESPARAVLEEHNSIHNGRAMRVQLRDCNPPRNHWKYGRGRGRHHQNQYGVNRKFHYRQPYDDHDNHQNGPKPMFHGSSNVPNGQISSLASTMSSVNLSSSSHNDVGSGSTEPTSLSDVSLGAHNHANSEKYREWYDKPESSTHTPEPSLVSSASMGVPSPYVYPIHQGQFNYPPQPWPQPYLSQNPYQVSYYPGYAIYPPAVPQATPQGFSSPSGFEVAGSSLLTSAGWPQLGVYASYIPYPAVFPRPTAVDQAQLPSVVNQAPLTPTGFIQNEQGTLIPVYQPEALDQYMASTGGPSVTAASRHPTAPPQRCNDMSPYTHESNGVQVGGFSQHYYAGCNRSKPIGISHSFPPPPQFPDTQLSSTPTHTNDIGNPMPLYRRGHRREINHSHNSTRYPSNSRWHNGRPVRGHVSNSGQMVSSDLGHPSMGAAASSSNLNR